MKRSAEPPFAVHRLIMSLLQVHTRMLQERLGPLLLWHWAVVWGRNRMRSKKRERDEKVKEEEISGLKERQRKRGVTKKERAGEWNEKIEGVMDGRGEE